MEQVAESNFLCVDLINGFLLSIINGCLCTSGLNCLSLKGKSLLDFFRFCRFDEACARLLLSFVTVSSLFTLYPMSPVIVPFCIFCD